MLVKVLIIFGMLLSVTWLWCFFTSYRHFFRGIILVEDAVLIILSVGTIVTGLILRNQYLDSDIKNEAIEEEYKQQRLMEEIAPTESYKNRDDRLLEIEESADIIREDVLNDIKEEKGIEEEKEENNQPVKVAPEVVRQPESNNSQKTEDGQERQIEESGKSDNAPTEPAENAEDIFHEADKGLEVEAVGENKQMDETEPAATSMLEDNNVPENNNVPEGDHVLESSNVQGGAGNQEAADREANQNESVLPEAPQASEVIDD